MSAIFLVGCSGDKAKLQIGPAPSDAVFLTYIKQSIEGKMNICEAIKRVALIDDLENKIASLDEKLRKINFIVSADIYDGQADNVVYKTSVY